MRNAVLLGGLRRRQLVVTVKLQLAVLNREERVGAPLLLVRHAAARLAATSPFVAEQELCAVVVERRRVPERHVGVGRRIEENGVLRIADVGQQTEASAGAAG